MFNNARKALAKIIFNARNSMTLPQQFLRYGNRGKTMGPDWAQVWMSDQDHYTGYSYAAITKRARAVARVASEFATTKIPDQEEKKNSTAVHPYFALIKDSKLFTEDQFYQTISTYIDLEGWFPLMVLRNSDAEQKRFGTPLKLELLSPYNVSRVWKKDTLELGGYIEKKDGFQREIPVSMIIPIFDLNPFDSRKPYAMTDAARESSYTLKSSGDYTRHVLRNNVDAPGILTTDVQLDDETFKNFVARLKDKTKGEPIIGNGANAVKWVPMTNDLSKSALKDITEVNRDILFAVSGVSKTKMGIEQSGTTRETSNVQKEQFIEDEIVPRIKTIFDALNLDYRNRYPQEYNKQKVLLGLNNPIESDQDIEGKKITNKKTTYELYKSIIDAGYDTKIASDFVEGNITLEDLGEPTNPPKVDPLAETVPPAKKKQAKNALPEGVIKDQESMLQNSLVNIEQQLAVAAVNRIPKVIKNNKAKNDIDEESDLITKSEKRDVKNQLILVLSAFYGIVTTIQGNEVMKDRIEKYGGEGKFILDKITKEGIKRTAELVAESHINTVANDLYKVAREAALEGKSQQEIISIVKTKYSHDISEVRAKAVARSETNRAFTMSQFEADRQFIQENGLEERAYKRYHTRSSNPCAFCQSLAAQGLIPFHEAFVKVGGQVRAKIDGKEVTFNVTFDNVFAGNLHTNCSCDYELVILKESK